MECDRLRITAGNDFTLVVVPMNRIDGEVVESFEPLADSATGVWIVTSKGVRVVVPPYVDGMTDNELHWEVVLAYGVVAIAITVPSEMQKVDGYGLVVVGEKDGRRWRYKEKPYEAFEIVDASSEQNVSEDNVRVYRIEAIVGIGLAGGSGDAGKSAYDIACEHGFEGTEEEWLESLNGSDGKSAYQVAVENGFEGTEEEWLESLNGSDGKSAYQLAVENGFHGTEQQWLESLKESVTIKTEESGISALSAEVDKYHVVPGTVTNLTVTLPTMTAATKIQGLVIYLKTGSGTPDIHFTSSHDVVLPKDYTIEANTIYEFNCIFNGLAWVVAYAAFEEQT
jgi:hypothetical protein